MNLLLQSSDSHLNIDAFLPQPALESLVTITVIIPPGFNNIDEQFQVQIDQFGDFDITK